MKPNLHSLVAQGDDPFPTDFLDDLGPEEVAESSSEVGQGPEWSRAGGWDLRSRGKKWFWMILYDLDDFFDSH